jgi:hypothetical protein
VRQDLFISSLKNYDGMKISTRMPHIRRITDIDDLDLRASKVNLAASDSQEYTNKTPAEKRLRLAKIYWTFCGSGGAVFFSHVLVFAVGLLTVLCVGEGGEGGDDDPPGRSMTYEVILHPSWASISACCSSRGFHEGKLNMNST